MTTSADRHLERIARGGALSIAGAGVSAIAGFVVTAVITNAYDKETAGVLFSATSLYLVLVALGGLGIEVGLGRFVPQLVVAGRWAAIRICLTWTAVAALVSSVLIAVGVWIWAEPIAAAMSLPADSGPLVLRILATTVPPTSLGLWALGATRAFANIRQTVWFDKIFRSVAQLVLVVWCAVAAGSVVFLTLAWVIPSVLFAPLAIIAMVRLVRRRAEPVADEPTSAGVMGQFWSFTWPRSVAMVSQVVIQRADIIIIAALISPAAAAVYTAATRFVPLGQLGVQAIQQVIQPRFTHLLATGERAALDEVFRTTTAWSMAMAWPLYLVIAGVPSLYLSLFGEGFDDEGVAVVLVMAVAMLIGVASGPIDTLLLMSGRSGLSLVNSLAALTVDLGLCLVLIPQIGILGAAVAWCVAVAVRALLGCLQVWRQLRISPLSRESLVVAVTAIGCFAAPLAVASVFTDSMVMRIVLMVVGAAAYGLVLWRNRRRLRLAALRSLMPGGRRRPDGNSVDRPSD
ncbi:MAG: oligosaccharide flippase family protein [Propionicimonas sp.]|uniref:polysaccharide biosynthesis C-terminal domain-containing protein n=1 Tax=Propionicimonas sp. TaxID=1955623 RepID=UPI003D114B6F